MISALTATAHHLRDTAYGRMHRPALAASDVPEQEAHRFRRVGSLRNGERRRYIFGNMLQSKVDGLQLLYEHPDRVQDLLQRFRIGTENERSYVIIEVPWRRPTI